MSSGSPRRAVQRPASSWPVLPNANRSGSRTQRRRLQLCPSRRADQQLPWSRHRDCARSRPDPALRLRTCQARTEAGRSDSHPVEHLNLTTPRTRPGARSHRLRRSTWPHSMPTSWWTVQVSCPQRSEVWWPVHAVSARGRDLFRARSGSAKHLCGSARVSILLPALHIEECA